MKWIYLLIFLLISSCSQFQRIPASSELNKDLYVVFDIDWTIVSEIKYVAPTFKDSKRVIEVGGIHYFINEGLEEFIEGILSKSDVKLSFYSGGSLERNMDLLSKIKLKDGTSLKDHADKILSKEDLVSIDGVSAKASFSERYKKDLSKVTKNLDRLIMFDDTPGFTFGYEQNQSVFFIGKSYEYFESFEQARKFEGEYIPKSYEDWLLNRKKLVILNRAFLEAYEESKIKKISFSEAMKKQEELLDLKSHDWNKTSKEYIGKRISRKLPSSLDCQQGMELFFNL